MKNNKQRADIILERYSNNKQPTEEVKTKKTAWWKIAIVVCSCLVLVFSASLGFFLFKRKATNTFDIDKMYIAHFNKYNAIGSGYIESYADNSTAKSFTKSARILKAATSSDKNKEQYLIGKKEDGTIEKLAFSNKQNGDADKEQNEGYIIGMLSFKNLTLFQWSKNKPTLQKGFENYYNYHFSNSKDNYGYTKKIFVIDHRTGKIFDLSKNNNIRDIEFYNKAFGTAYPYGDYSLESDNYIYFTGHQGNNYDTYVIFRMSVENNELKIEEVLSQSKLQFYERDLFVDKYGNLFISSGSAPYISDAGVMHVKYCITPDNKIISMDKDLFRSINGIVYTYDKTKKINANGEFVDNTFMDCFVTFPRETIVKSYDNIDYYYSTNNKIHKITWIDEEQFSYDSINIEGHSGNYVVTNDYIYFYNDQQVFSIEILTGKKKDLVSDYIFTGISADNLGNVMFTAIASNLDDVTGILYNDGTIDISQSAKKYKIYYIKPIN